MAEVIDRLHQAGVYGGLGAFSPPGTRPPLVGLAVPEDFVLPEGYVRHYQATDDGQRIEPILMFSPDHQFCRRREPADRDPEGPRRAAGARAARAADPAHRDSCADRTGETRALSATDPSFRLGGRMAAGILASAVLACLYARGGAGWLLGFVALVPWLRALDASRTLAAHAARRLGDVGRLHRGGLRLVRRRDRQLHAARRRHRPGGAARSPRRCSSRSSSPSRWCATSPAAGTVPCCARSPAPRPGSRPSGSCPGCSATRSATGCIRRGCCARPPTSAARRASRLLLLLANEGIAAALARRAGGVRAMARAAGAGRAGAVAAGGYGLAALSGHARAGRQAAAHGAGAVEHRRLRAPAPREGRRRGRPRGARHALRDDATTPSSGSAPTRCCGRRPCTPRPSAIRRARPAPSSTARSWASSTPPACRSCSAPTTATRPANTTRPPSSRPAPACSASTARRAPSRSPSTCPPGSTGRRCGAGCRGPAAGGRATGARVFPLRLADGREIPVLPLICLDDMDAGLAIDGARLGAQAILTMSNDSWFTDHPQGAELHLAAAAFRSIETRLPQFRVTTNGYSAVIDATGSVIAAARMGERTLVIGDVPVREPPRTLMVAWGDWVGRAARWRSSCCWPRRRRCARWRTRACGRSAGIAAAPALPADVAVLPPAARLAAGLLRAFARGSLLWMGAAVLLGRWRPADEHAGADPHVRRALSGARGRRMVRAARLRRARLDRARRAGADARRAAPRTRAAGHRRRRAVARAPSRPRCLAAAGLRRALALRARARRSGRAGSGAGRGRCRARCRSSAPSRATAYAQARAGHPARAPRPSAREVRPVPAGARAFRRSACTSTSRTAAPSASTTRSA